jgi:metal-responsive CopG/Arc/MetJ family transcriptional regulator
MSRILSFSTDKDFAKQLEGLVAKSGYKNRSMFLRDASIHFCDAMTRGDIYSMTGSIEVEGTMVIYYQHNIENKLLELRHSHSIEISSYSHNCLTSSHTCVDTMQIKGTAKLIREAIQKLQNTDDIDRIEFIAAPVREDGCC